MGLFLVFQHTWNLLWLFNNLTIETIASVVFHWVSVCAFISQTGVLPSAQGRYFSTPRCASAIRPLHMWVISTYPFTVTFSQPSGWFWGVVFHSKLARCDPAAFFLCLFWACCLFIFRNPSFLLYLMSFFFYLAWFCLHLNSEFSLPYSAQSTVSSFISYPLKSIDMFPIVELLQSSNPAWEFVFSIDSLNRQLFEPMALWFLPHQSVKSALFLAIISARRTGAILAFGSAKISGRGYILNFESWLSRELCFQCLFLRFHPSSEDWYSYIICH